MTPGVEIPPLAVGTLIGGGHRIEQVLGQGGFGVTYRARRQSGGSVCDQGILPAWHCLSARGQSRREAGRQGFLPDGL